ncbi:aromatase/cyclase [Nocardia sp. CNY236]|uniref:aromatase/cyclase n=1 Tax=Nocardia sp. CNY236 TaxID=1169152 RepID=UPI000411C6B0|nr:aromatase/cyclase [Nocardia sp. CNY236]
MQAEPRRVEHGISIDAPAEVIYRLIIGVEDWPTVFPPTVHVECLERSGDSERIRIWATANGSVKTWISRREFDHERRQVTFRQEVSAPPVAAMGGQWVVEPTSASTSRVRLYHDYRAVNDDPEGLAWIEAAVDRNSQAELAALSAAATRTADDRELMLSFEDSISVPGRAEDVYDFLNRADLWPQRLPHVAEVALQEDVPGQQLLEMTTEAADGSVHTTTSIRICSPHDRIIYKQIGLPALMELHTGCWSVRGTETGVFVTSQHTVIIRRENIEPILGAGADSAQARAFIRNALGTNSRATLQHAKQYVEQRV